MNYQLTLSVSENAEELYKAVQPENLETSRAKVTVTKEKNSVVFSLDAKDIHAFRAMETAIMRLITIHAKMRKVVDGVPRNH